MRRPLPLLVASLVAAALVLTGCGSVPSADGRTADTARLASDAGVVVVAAGDIACAPGKAVTRTTCKQAATARAAAALSPARVLALGDLQYEKGSYKGFTRSYDASWGALRSITWPVPGNHEYYSAGAAGYYRYFAGQQPGAPGYYRQSLGGWQLYFLNSNCDRIDCRAEKAWLDAEMTANPSTCSLIALHYPRFSSGGEHGSDPKMRKFWRIGYAHGADVALSGHDHDQERFAPMTPAGTLDDLHGIQQFVSGGGGKSLYPKGRTAPGSQFFKSKFGVLELTLQPNAYAWRFLSPKLKVRDSGTAPCR